MSRAQLQLAPSVAALAVEREPLYLDPRDAARVTLEGPALKIQCREAADRYVPLRRVSRIIATCHAQFATEVLLACAERGITVVLADARGEVCARLLGRPGERQELRQRMLDLMARPDWKDLYGGWLFAVDRQARLEVHRRLRVPDDVGVSAGLTVWLERYAVRLAGRDAAANSRNWLRELADAWMTNHLSQLGLGAQSELLLDGWPDLVGDLSRVLYWQLEPVRLGWLRRRLLWAEQHGRALGRITRRDMITVFHKSGTRIGRAGRALTNRLHFWLVELA